MRFNNFAYFSWDHFCVSVVSLPAVAFGSLLSLVVNPLTHHCSSLITSFTFLPYQVANRYRRVILATHANVAEASPLSLRERARQEGPQRGE